LEVDSQRHSGSTDSIVLLDPDHGVVARDELSQVGIWMLEHRREALELEPLRVSFYREGPCPAADHIHIVCEDVERRFKCAGTRVEDHRERRYPIEQRRISVLEIERVNLLVLDEAMATSIPIGMQCQQAGCLVQQPIEILRSEFDPRIGDRHLARRR